MLSTQDISYRYTPTNPVLQFPDIQCLPGEHWLLLGQSGSGKTTLLHILGGLRTPDKGSVRINQTEINQLSSAKLDQFRGEHIGIVFQQAYFVKSLTVAENLKLAQSLAGKKANMTAIKEILGQLNLDDKIHAKTGSLSVGERQRVAIARAVINQPSVILADEPTSALDDENTDRVIQLLRQQAGAVNATLLIVTHDNRLTSVFDKQIQL